MPDGGAKKKTAGWFRDNLGKAGQAVSQLSNRITGGWFPSLQRYTKYKPPVEKILDSMGAIGAFEKYITAVATVEEMWGIYRKEWEKLIELYSYTKNEKGVDVGVGVYRSWEIIEKECGRAKYGFGVSEDLLRAEGDNLRKSMEGKKQKEIETKVMSIKEDKGAHQMRIYNGNLKEEYKNKPEYLFKTRYKFEYPTPKTVKTRYWHSLMHDKDEVLNEYEYSYFGFNKIPVWLGEYVKVVEDVCDQVTDGILGRTKETEKVVNELTKDEVSNVENNIKGLKTHYIDIFQKFMDEVKEHERNHYNFLRDIGGNSIRIDNMKSSLLAPERLPEKAIEGVKGGGGIYFKHSYKIINPERIIDIWSWNNVIGLYKELVRLLRIIYEDDEKKVMAGIDSIHKKAGAYKKVLDDFWFAYKQDLSKSKFLRPLILVEGGELQQGIADDDHGMEYILKKRFKINKEGERVLLEFLREIFKKYNSMLHNSNKKEHKGKSFLMDGIEGFETWEGERAPGWDENGWPLEISDENFNFRNFVQKAINPASKHTWSGKGYVLLDVYNRHKVSRVREIPDEFVEEMDLLLAATCIHNEWDAMRDDLRDGRCHIGSLTITDYAMAMKRFVGTRSVGGLKSQLPQISMIGENKLDKRANNEPNDKNNPRRYEMYVYNEDGTINREPEVAIRRPVDLNPAFDRNAFKTGSWWHVGRKRYYDFAVNIIEDLDDEKEIPALIGAGVIGPAISSRGISMYIIEKVLFEVPYYEDAQNLLIRLSGKVWYDYGPRAFNKPGSKDPLNIDPTQLAAANKSVMEGE